MYSYKPTPSRSRPIPAVSTCVNASTVDPATAWTQPLSSAPPAGPTTAPCASYPTSGGAAVVEGVWTKTTSSVIETMIGWGTANWNANPLQLSGTTGVYQSSQCLNASECAG